jgi:hypothetical protein
MGLTDKLMQVVNGARKLRASRDPNSYSHYDPGSTVRGLPSGTDMQSLQAFRAW